MKKVITFAAILFVFAVGAVPVSAQTNISGVVSDVKTDGSGALTGFTVLDENGVSITFTVTNTTEFGLEDRAGDRWVARFAGNEAEAAGRLLDHQRRFAPITVSSEDGQTALTVTESFPRNLDANLIYLGSAFAVVWIFFFAYIFWIWRKQNRIDNALRQKEHDSV